MKAHHVFLALAACVPAVSAQHVLSTLNGANSGDNFGQAVAVGIDLNADGYSDYAVGIPGHDVVQGLGGGRVRAYNGKTGAILWTVSGPVTGGQFGFAVAGVPDVNGDGRDDVAASNPISDSDGLTNNGRVQILSGSNGAVLLTVNGTQAEERMGEALACPGDLNGDGIADLAVGSPRYNHVSGFTPLTDAGRVRALNGATGAVLWNAFGEDSYAYLGDGVSSLGDWNASGSVDVLVEARGEGFANSPVENGYLTMRSGSSGGQLTKVSVIGSFDGLAAGLGDTNGDGYPEAGFVRTSTFVTFGFPPTYDYTHYWRVLSGPTADMLYGETFSGPFELDYPTAILPAGDVDRDDRQDFALVYNGLIINGRIEIHSGADQELLWNELSGVSGLTGGHAGDVNGDGWPDLVLGHPFVDGSGGTDAGRVQVLDTLYNQADLGSGGPGNARLAAYGTRLDGGGECDLVLSGAPGGKLAFLLASPAQAPMPFKGGTLLPSVALAFSWPLFTLPDGSLPILGVPGGGGPADLYVQYAVSDPAQPLGAALSNAVKLAFLP